MSRSRRGEAFAGGRIRAATRVLRSPSSVGASSGYDRHAVCLSVCLHSGDAQGLGEGSVCGHGHTGDSNGEIHFNLDLDSWPTNHPCCGFYSQQQSWHLPGCVIPCRQGLLLICPHQLAFPCRSLAVALGPAVAAMCYSDCSIL